MGQGLNPQTSSGATCPSTPSELWSRMDASSGPVPPAGLVGTRTHGYFCHPCGGTSPQLRGRSDNLLNQPHVNSTTTLCCTELCDSLILLQLLGKNRPFCKT